jgi:hypothetical protein
LNYFKHHGKKEIYDLINRFAVACVKLHEFDPNLIGENILVKPRDKYSYAKKCSLLVNELTYEKNWNYKSVTEWLTTNAEECPCENYSLLHVDMNFKNLIVTKDKEIVFLDWEWAEVGDASRDVASAFYEVNHVAGEQAASFFLNQYVKCSSREINKFKLRFYLVCSGLNLACFFKSIGKELGTKALVKIFGLRSLPLLPIIRWHFIRRGRRIDRYIQSEVLDYEKGMFNTPGGRILSKIEKQKILELTNSDSSDLILDVGTASGRIAREIILKTGARVIGIDLGYQSESSQKKKRLNNYELIIADGQYMPFKEDSFNAIICIRALKYFPNYVLGLSEMKRVLRKTGRLTLDLSSNLGYEIILRSVTHSLGARGHHVFNVYRLKNMITSMGLSVRQSSY